MRSNELLTVSWKDGAIIWIFADNPKLKKLLAESTRFR